jgi:branched-chain amino acid transport system substrate-binding protein
MPAPIRIGVLNDSRAGPPANPHIERLLHEVTDGLLQAERLDRGIELVNVYGMGLPAGSAAVVERSYAELAEQDVLMILGPAIGDDALVATPLAERFRIPTMNWAGAERARSEYMFHLQVGSHEDEPVLLARHMAALGVRRLGVVYDRSPIGVRYMEYLRTEAEILGQRIAAAVPIAPLAETADSQVDEVLDGRPEGVVYLGLGFSTLPFAQALAARGWTGPRTLNTAGLRGYDPAYARVVDGWTYLDMFSDTNATLNALRARLGPDGPPPFWAAVAYDLARLVGEGLARAPELTREGVREGLEQIKWIPAAEGHEGALLGFGRQDRGALHGRFMVLRRWVGGETIQAEP